MNNKKKLFGTILGVAAFVVLVAGVTYAWFTWASENTIINGTSGCFNIAYDKGTDVSGTLNPSATYEGGANATVKINISDACNITGAATISLNTNAETNLDLAAGAVKYAVYQGDSEIATGTITATGDKELATVALTQAATATTEYTVYVWIDGALSDNSYVGKTYSGYIHASATQTES